VTSASVAKCSQVVPEKGQDGYPEDITYYDDPPFDDGNYLAHGVDLAISTKDSADYTAVVTGEVTWPTRGAGDLHPDPPNHPAHDVHGHHDTSGHGSTMSSEST
jgi:hypothetical protein